MVPTLSTYLYEFTLRCAVSNGPLVADLDSLVVGVSLVLDEALLHEVLVAYFNLENKSITNCYVKIG